ncbi:hypothetical protein DSM107003_47050 [Trichormus variabilis SAG 1403-4b]|uniref:Uncharacterized protein n=1 Tax=Trichormus variabilis SAG 1403-4b TaxID=447716 RepID=A0A3S1CIA8_ANAVA|nr:hypothetical protein DSM107003_47050 [Trichormus variabilis SAG 1403-4b]
MLTIATVLLGEHQKNFAQTLLTALPGVMRYKTPTPESDEGAKMHLIRAETAVFKVFGISPA